MKKIFLGSIVLSVFSISILLFQASCTKQATAQTTNLTKQEILTQKQWKVDQLHSVISGVYASYYSGGSNTTGVNYDNMKFTFKTDGTASYVDPTGTPHAATWQFASSDQRSLKITINDLSVTNNWQMVEIAGSYLHATENFTLGTNTNNLHSFRLVQIP